MSSVLVTGGAGFIGCRLTSALLGSGHDVFVLDNLHPQVHGGRGVPAELARDARFLPGDVTASPEAWDAVIVASRPATVVHLAAETGTGQSLTEPTRHAAVNVVGTAGLVEAFERTGWMPRHVVLASSRAVYGDGAWKTEDGRVFYPGSRSPQQLAAGMWDHRHPDGSAAHPVASRAGTTVPHPTNVYAATKLAQEHVLGAWCGARGVDLSVLRLQNVYGPGQSVTNAYTGVLVQFARTAIGRGVIDVFEDGAIVRDFVHVDDVVRAIAATVEQPGRRLLDVGSGRPVTIADVSAMIADAAGAPPPEISGRYRLGDVRAAWCETGDLRDEIGVALERSLADGVCSLVEWVGRIDVVPNGGSGAER